MAVLAALAGALLLPATSELLAPLWPGHHGLTRSDLVAALLIQASLGPAWLLIALPRSAPDSARGWVGTADALGLADDEQGEAAGIGESTGILLGREEGATGPSGCDCRTT